MLRLFIFVIILACNEKKEVTKTLSSLEKCQTQSIDCGNLDMDTKDVEKLYKKGCDKKDYYSCFRLGQFLEMQSDNLNAIKLYNKSCDGKDKYGCESSYDLHMKLCYDYEQKDFCGKKDPKGEYRIVAYLENFDDKYQDAFYDYNFSYPFNNQKAKSLFKKHLKNKNPKLLKALEDYRGGLNDDGDSAETRDVFINYLKGLEKSIDFLD